MRFSPPTKFSNRVRNLLIPIVAARCSEEFNPDKLKYGFLSRMGADPNTGYISVLYFYYCTDLKSGRYMVFDVGLDKPQNELKGHLSIVPGCSQCKYVIIDEGDTNE